MLKHRRDQPRRIWTLPILRALPLVFLLVLGLLHPLAQAQSQDL